MLLSAVSVLVVAQSSSEIPEGLMNNPVFTFILGSSPDLLHSRQPPGHLHTLQLHKSISLSVLPPLRTRVWGVNSKRRTADNTSRG